MTESIENVKYESARIRNDIFILTDQYEKELKIKTKQNEDYNINIKITEDKIKSLIVENKSKSIQLDLLLKKFKQHYQKNEKYLDKIRHLNSCDLPWITKLIKEKECKLKELDDKYKKSQTSYKKIDMEYKELESLQKV